MNEPSTKTAVYIDGENTFFYLFDTLKKARLIRHRDELVKLDLYGLIKHYLPEEEDLNIRYYGAKLKEISDSGEDLLRRTQKMIDHKRRWIGYLSNTNVDFVDAGELKIRRGYDVKRQEPELIFIEKGVDIRLAVDLMEDAMQGQLETAVIASSDSDLLPVVQALKRHGVRVIYVAFEANTNDAMAGSADKTITIANKQIIEAFKRAN